jgi:hypothetical protein
MNGARRARMTLALLVVQLLCFIAILAAALVQAVVEPDAVTWPLVALMVIAIAAWAALWRTYYRDRLKQLRASGD